MNLSRISLLVEQCIISGTNFLASLWVAREYGAGSLTYYTLILSILFYINSVQHSLLFSFLFSRSYFVGKFRFVKSLNVQVNISLFLILFFSFASGILLTLKYLDVFETISLLVFFLGLNTYEFLRKWLIYERRSGLLISGAIIANILPFIILIRFSTLDVLGYFQVKTVLSFAFLILFVSFARFNLLDLITFYRLGHNWGQHFRFGKWLVLGSSLQWTSGYVFLYGAALIIGSEAAGYVIAVKSLFGLTSLMYQYYESYVPIFIKRSDTRAARVRSVVRASLEVFIMCGLFLIIMNLFGEEIIVRVLGDNYANYTWLIVWFSLITLFEMGQRPLLILLRSFDATNVVFWAYAVSSVLAFISVYPLVSVYGQLGIVTGLLILQVALVTCYAAGVAAVLRKRALSEG